MNFIIRPTLTASEAWSYLAEQITPDNRRGLCVLIRDLYWKHKITGEVRAQMQNQIIAYRQKTSNMRAYIWPLDHDGNEKRRAFCLEQANEKQ